MSNNVDKTIDSICEWICKNIKQVSADDENVVLPDMIHALAKLISARA